MVLSENSINTNDDFYSPISATGYLTPLQRAKLREKRNTPLTSAFENDFKTPKSSTKSAKKPKRPLSSKPKSKDAPKHKIRTQKEQVPKPSKENHSELRYSVASLVSSSANDGTPKEKKFFKNRSPQHLQKTEFVMPLSYKKRSLDFTTAEKKLSPPELIGQNGNKSEARRPMGDISTQTNNSNSTATTPKRKALTDNTISPESEEILSSDLEKTIDLTPKRKIQCRSEPPKSVDNIPRAMESRRVNTDPRQAASVTPKHKVAEPVRDVTELCLGGDVFNFEWPSDDELLKRQSDARARLKRALMMQNTNVQVKKVVVDVTDAKVNVSSEKVTEETSPRLFPIFTNMKSKKVEAKESASKKPSNTLRDTSKGEDQMIIDAGQKEIGSRLCKTCNMLYAIGHEEDERLHMGYHDMFLLNLKFTGWKNECIVGDFDDGRVIKILDTDKSFMLKKVEDVLYIANRDLGFPTGSFPTRPNVMFFLFVSSDKRVGGCLVAEPIESACPVVLEEENSDNKPDEKPLWKLGNWYASTKPVKAICGINRIWVAKEFRRQKVASRLIDCLRGCFIYGHVVDCKEMAFTDPSPDGRMFAASYTGTDNFLVYK